MWTKLTSVLKTRSDIDVPSPNVPTHSSRGTKSLDLQRMLPALPTHEFDSPKQLPAPSPPSSPSKYGRLGLFRRSSKANGTGNYDESSVRLTKKVRANLNINTNFNVSNVSITPSNYTSEGARMLSPTDSKPPPLPTAPVRSNLQPRSAPALDLTTVNDATSYFSQTDDVPKSAPLLDSPMTPFDFTKNAQGSVRSILKDKRTPGTGQSVRFFSRDAYRVISPDSSTASASLPLSNGNDLEKLMDMKMDSMDPLPAPAFAQSRQEESAEDGGDGRTNYMSATDSIEDLFSPLNAPSPASSRDGLFLDVQARHMNSEKRISTISQAGSSTGSTLFVAIPPPDMQDPFDLSAALEYGVQPIPFSVPSSSELPDQQTDAELVFRQPSDQTPAAIANKNTFHSTPNGIASGTRSLGRRGGGALFKALPGGNDSTEKGRSSPVPDLPVVAPPRSSSSLGLYKLFSKDAEKNDNQPSVDVDASASVLSSSKVRRERAQSEKVFFRSATPLFQDEIKKTRKERPEADINDTSKTDIVLSPTDGGEEHLKDKGPMETFSVDPFGANAKGYYTAEAGIPNSPPKLLQQHNRTESGDSKSSRTSSKSSKSVKSTLSRTSHKSNKSQTSISALNTSAESTSMSSYSDNSEMVLNLRTQLAFHQELTSQFEKDISSRDELVSLLNSKILNFEDEAKERSRTLRSWRKKINDMEKACRTLEEQLDRSKQEIAERSVYDEASGDALRALHTQIKQLEREKRDVEKREKDLKEENDKLRKDKNESAAAEQQLKASIEEAARRMNEMDMGNMSMGSLEGRVDDIVPQREAEFTKETERHLVAESAWDEERASLLARIRELESRISLQDVVDAREAEIGTLNEEIQNQWTRSDKLTAKIEELLTEKLEMEKECDHLKNELTNIEEKDARLRELEDQVAGAQEREERMMHMEVEWTESENRRNELESELSDLYNARDEDVRERDQILEELHAERERADQTSHTLQSLETRASLLEQERDFANTNVDRLEGIMRERNEEISELKGKLGAKDKLLDALQDDLSALRREHSRLASDKSRTSSEVDEARSRVDEALRGRAQAEAEAQLSSSRVKELETDVEKLRRQIHLLKQSSADLEVKLVQAQKQYEQAKEDKHGLNFALELKQEELQAVRRKLSSSKVENTPTPSTVQRTGVARRESALFATPLPARPPSSLSENGSKVTKVSDTPSTIGKPTALGRNTRISNAASSATPTVSKIMPPPSRRPSLSNSTSSQPILSRSILGKPSSNLISTSTQGSHKRASSLATTMTSRTALARSVSASANLSDTSSIAEDKENDSVPSTRAPTPSKLKGNPSSTPGPRTARKSLVAAS